MSHVLHLVCIRHSSQADSSAFRLDFDSSRSSLPAQSVGMSVERRIDSLEIEVPNRSVSLEIHEESSDG